VRLVARLFDGSTQPAFLGAFASELSKREKTVAVLARSECGHIFLAQHSSAGRDMASLLKQILEQVSGKGGGSRDAARGRLAEAAKAAEAVEIAKKLLEGAPS
jgi:alanyl-tRNA synthetase